MRVRFGGAERRGRAVDLRDCGVTAGGAAAAVRKQSDDRVACQPPGRVHERVGVLHRGMSVSVRAALAAAARSRGATTDCDADLRAVEAELESLAPADVDLSGARERVAETAAAVDRLREVVARASGRVEACRDAGDASDAKRRSPTRHRSWRPPRPNTTPHRRRWRGRGSRPEGRETTASAGSRWRTSGTTSGGRHAGRSPTGGPGGSSARSRRCPFRARPRRRASSLARTGRRRVRSPGSPTVRRRSSWATTCSSDRCARARPSTRRCCWWKFKFGRAAVPACA
jgi:hypothetical protein